MLAKIEPGDVGAPGRYNLLGVVNTFRVNQNNTTTPLVELTAYSIVYGVTYTWAVSKATYTSNGGDVLASEKTAQVEAICAAPHVQGLRTEKDEDDSDLLYNYAVITVGTDDGTITDTATVRMDHLGTPGAFGAIAAVWAALVKTGAPAAGV
jgi:hypothetical protein